MSRACEFLKACGSFIVITMNGDCPAGSPFGAVMEVGERIGRAFSDGKEIK